MELPRKKLKAVTTELTVASIPSNAILDGVIRLLQGREIFRDTDDSLDEKMYAGHVFEDIASEQAQLPDGHRFKQSQKVLDQLDVLAEFVSHDYVLITNV
jgi:hypothetical protein